ncbi:hypothetical protein [Natrinema sp. 1APR25-10V2]|uniref:hypothetical protein n=1 Tax=Natrinema sp. 1APR25-10V2 TaxID=2951081 RepID=UPI0028746680|nr:hypothetical protein [Natrinema sp. 1APR25-10V2]MDS0475652.1 hypothetical protein [Natrinema sp. 1APR25-10V2]
MPAHRDQSATLLARLEGTACSFCDEGHLVSERDTGTDAVVCAACGTPGARSWTAKPAAADAASALAKSKSD